MAYAGGYARSVMNLIHEFSKSDTERIGPLMEEACEALSQMRGSDPYRLWLNIQVLSLYDKHLEPAQLKKYQDKHDEIKARVVDNYSKNTINCTTLLKDLKQVKYEIDVLEQAKSSTRISVAAIDFYRSSMDKRIDTASHEIRNAVSILKMSVEAVKDGHIDFSKGMIETMLRKIESIGCIVDELDLEDEKQMSIQKMPSQTSVDHIATYCEMAYAYVENRVHIHRNDRLDDKHVVATLQPVTQVMDNLVSNALKYSPGSSKVHIHYEERSNFITFHIQDQGCGISDQDQIHIFEPYFRASSTEKEEGKGLGLHFCRQTIQMLGGDIWVKSHLGQGSEFSFSLPVKRI
jgi:signal transduction histidine kinase